MSKSPECVDSSKINLNRLREDSLSCGLRYLGDVANEIERLRAELDHKDAYYAQFDLEPKGGHETDRPLIDEGKLWSFLRDVLTQGCAIEQDSQKQQRRYEYHSACLDAAARERTAQFAARVGIAQEKSETNTASAVSSEGAPNADQTAAGADLGSKREPSPASADIDRQKLRNAIGGTFVENSGPRAVDDNLAIALCTFFDDHRDCPDEPNSDEHGWKPWVVEKCNWALDAITDAAMRAITGRRAVEKSQSRELSLIDFGWAPGNYTFICHTCEQEGHGDKRSLRCETCATAALRDAQNGTERHVPN